MSKIPPFIEVPYTHTFKSGRKVQAHIKLVMFENRMSFIHKKPTGGTELANFPSKPFETLLNALSQRSVTKPKKLTVGYRARFKKNPSSWKEYAGREVLLEERNSSGEFSVMLIPKGMKELKVTSEALGSGMAWVAGDDLEFVDDNLEANIAHIDACQEAEDWACPDCGHFDGEPKVHDGDYVCPECKCHW